MSGHVGVYQVLFSLCVRYWSVSSNVKFQIIIIIRLTWRTFSGSDHCFTFLAELRTSCFQL